MGSSGGNADSKMNESSLEEWLVTMEKDYEFSQLQKGGTNFHQLQETIISTDTSTNQ